ncbi:MAG: cupredoxin domain-containing protein [Dehalococcoidia bacterium]
MLWKLLAIALLTAGLTAAVACGDDDDDDTSGDDAASTTAPAGETGTDAPDGGDELEPLALQASDFAFTPTDLTAVAGDPYELTVTNSGNTAHTFTVDSLSIDEEIPGGESVTIEVTFPVEATEFYCRFHQSEMTGSLTPE